jgi:hypothetical protein
MSLATFDERNALSQSRLVLPADGTALVPLVTVNSQERRIDTILVANRDGIAHVINVVTTVGAVVTNLGSVSVPAGQGYLGTPSLDILAAVLPATQVGLVLMPGQLVGVQLAVAVVATFDVSVTAQGGVF